MLLLRAERDPPYADGPIRGQAQAPDRSGPPPDAELIGLIAVIAAFAGFLLFGVVYSVTWAFYSAREMAIFASYTTLDRACFRLDATGASLVWLVLGNLLLIIFTLGIATPFAQRHTPPTLSLPSAVPPIAEIQVALQDAVSSVTGLTGENLKSRMRTGTVVTTDDRNWELRFNDLYSRFNRSRAIAIDMESATVAANGFRLRVPYGTLLCVSDKPLHGEIKLPGAANAFYDRAVGEHLMIGLAAIELLRTELTQLHSRKLRSFDEPPFR